MRSLDDARRVLVRGRNEMARREPEIQTDAIQDVAQSVGLVVLSDMAVLTRGTLLK